MMRFITTTPADNRAKSSWEQRHGSTEAIMGRNESRASAAPGDESTGTSSETTQARLRILALNWRCLRHPQSGGAELNLFAQAERWVEDGHEVTVVCADPGRAVAPQRDEIINGVAVRRRGGRFGVYLYAALFMLTHGRHFDRVLDVANGIPFFAPLFIGRPVVLLVHHVHGSQWFEEFPRPLAAFGWLVERRIVPLVYRMRPVITVSSTTRDALTTLGFAATQVRIVHNGVRHPARQNDTRPTADHRIAYVGRLKRYKRLDLLVRAVADLRRTFPDLRLDIAGDGDARPEIEALIDRLGLRDHITVHGFVDEAKKDSILRAATVFATPSMHEGWGVSVIEANTYGCPVVAYDVPGLRVAVRHGETGMLARDDAAFQAALAEILCNVTLRERLSRGARAWAALFNWDSCARATLSILRASSTGDTVATVPVDITAVPHILIADAPALWDAPMVGATLEAGEHHLVDAASAYVGRPDTLVRTS